MVFAKIFKKMESLMALDLGSTAIKLIELDLEAEKPKILNVACASTSVEAISNNIVTKPQPISDQITEILEANGIGDRRVVTAVPAPSVFTKRIKMPKVTASELRSAVQMEAGNFIPHNIDAVRLDFHVIGEADRNQLDVLVAAVKNEVIDSFLDCIALSGLETAIVDVDYFALQNVFELNHPDLMSQTVALVNMGARYSSINICREGQALFCGDISVGGKLLTEALKEGLGIQYADAEKIKRTAGSPGLDEATREIIDRHVEYAASEFNRQLSFFWNASGADGGIDRILLSGGGSLLPGLGSELAERTGIEVGKLSVFKALDGGENVDREYLKEIEAQMAIAVGMAIRTPGDKEIPGLE